MPPPAPFSDVEQQRLRDLHAAGKSCNAIAREMHRSPDTISRWAKTLGLTFDRAKVVAATAAKTVDNRARRTDLIERMYARAARVLDRLEADQFAHWVTGGEAPFVARDPDPPAKDERDLSSSIANYMGTAIKAEAVDANVGEADGRSMLEALADGLKAAARAQRPAGPDDGPS